MIRKHKENKEYINEAKLPYLYYIYKGNHAMVQQQVNCWFELHNGDDIKMKTPHPKIWRKKKSEIV